MNKIIASVFSLNNKPSTFLYRKYIFPGFKRNGEKKEEAYDLVDRFQAACASLRAIMWRFRERNFVRCRE